MEIHDGQRYSEPNVHDEEKYGEAEISPAPLDDGKIDTQHADLAAASPEQLQKLAMMYGLEAEKHGIAPRNDMQQLVDRIIEMSEEDAMQILVVALEHHRDDPNFPSADREMITRLVQGYKLADMVESDWLFDLRAYAAIIYYHSPYPEVRSVTDPFDDPNMPCETWRAYFWGMSFMAGSSALNTFFSPRQPGISLGSNVLQLLLAPCGQVTAKILPKRSFSVRGYKFELNPGPWTYKEQVFATIMFAVGNGVGGVYYVYLVQRLPQYLGQSWVTLGYEIALALATQIFGFGFAGLLRRFVVYPVTAIWPRVLPTLALNRALVVAENKGENVNGWKFTRYQFFFLTFALMFVWFWIPNSLFTALHGFNWMTWIAPQNFNLAMVTGFYGGMGFNPWATFDWNVSGTGALVTPFYSTFQQYCARIVSGIIILGMFYGNYFWSAYMPINSNESFANNGEIYNLSRVVGQDGLIDIPAYMDYGPPYFSGANIFGQIVWFAWYPMVFFYVTIRWWSHVKAGMIGLYRGFRHKASPWSVHDDAHCRMMRAYKEVPDWWFFLVLVISVAIGIVSLTVWPTHTPWWSLFPIIGLSAAFLVPSSILQAAANVGMGFNVLFQILAGTWFGGNPEAQMIMVSFGQNFNVQADTYISNQKLAHYAKIPPRAIFRGQMLSVIINCLIFVGMLNWMITNYDNGTLCTWDNAQHFVCEQAVLTFSTATDYGAFGVRNLFKLYPFLPYCFLYGAIIGIVWAVGHVYGQEIRRRTSLYLSERKFEFVDKWGFRPISYLRWFDPTVTWAGTLNWTGGSNLSWATNAMYLSFIFMYYIKRHYGRWWEKYNYLLEAGFDVGVAISGIIQSFVFGFATHHGKELSVNWWGNTVSTAGADFQSYNQNGSLYPIPPQGFGLTRDQYPLDF